MNPAATDPGVAVRLAAARLVERVVEHGDSLDGLWPRADRELPDPRDRAQLRAIVNAALRTLPRAATLLDRLLQRPLPKRETAARYLLLVALVQLDGGIGADYAVVGSTVSAMRALGKAAQAGLANAVLRRFGRERAALVAALPGDDGVRYGHPPVLAARIRRDWPGQADAIMAAAQVEAPLWLRVNRRRATVAAVAAELAADGIAARTVDGLPDALVLPQSLPVDRLPGFAAGALSVQDGAAQLAVELLDLAPGQRFLDACAAPGGKLAHALEREPALAALALERDPRRAERIAQNLARLGLAADCRVADAAAVASWWDGRPFDRILLDAPCSGLGVIRRHPDIRWRRDADGIAHAVAEQQRLLDALWPLLAPGGRLVYATCSILPDENALSIDRFRSRHADATVLPVVPDWFGRAAGGGRQLLPGEHGMDGFYYAVLARG